MNAALPAERLKNDQWDGDGCRTPDQLFEELHARYGFVVDLFASKENAKLPKFFTKEDSALEHEWPRLTRELERSFEPKTVVMIDGEPVIFTQMFPPDLEYGWCFGNPPYSAGNIEKAVSKAIEQAQRGSGVVLLIPSSTGVGWFQDLLLKRCDVLDACVVNRSPKVKGYELSCQGIGYRQKILFLQGRVPFKRPLDYPEGRAWWGPAGDSILLELRPPLR